MVTFSITKLIRRCRVWHILAGFCLAGCADQVQGQFNYVINNGTITITGITAYTGPNGSVIIPDEINNTPVTAIGNDAFANFSETSVTIPDSVTTIGDNAFVNCASLTSVTIPDTITTIGYGVFYGCSSLSNIILPDTTTTIGGAEFNNCFSLTNIIIPDSVTTIQQDAFAQCSSLTSVSIPDSVVAIGEGAFANCYVLTNVAIGSGVTNIGDGAFAQCRDVIAYTVDQANTSYSSVDGVLFDKLQTTLIQYPGGATGSYTIPGGITSLADFAFNDEPLSSITIPSSVTNLGHTDFGLCFNLTAAYFQGNAPANDSSQFKADPTTIYYLPGTIGWNTNFSGRPTALWTLPYPKVLDGSVSVQSNQLNFTVSWATNASVIVEACTDLANPMWHPVQTNTLTDTPDGGWFAFSDPQSTHYPARFYRVVTQ